MKKMVLLGVNIALFTAFFGVTTVAYSGEDLIKEGEKLAFNRGKGNCIACHAMPTADPKKATLAGTIGPPLVGMMARFPEEEKLYNQIFDASKINPNSIMPPFGKHLMLTEKEIRAITAYIHTL